LPYSWGSSTKFCNALLALPPSSFFAKRSRTAS
jgi:hypothetical protein